RSRAVRPAGAAGRRARRVPPGPPPSSGQPGVAGLRRPGDVGFYRRRARPRLVQPDARARGGGTRGGASGALVATPREWLSGARPRTLPAAIVPVTVGSGVAFGYGRFSLWRAALALVVAISLQVGVNSATYYCDG